MKERPIDKVIEAILAQIPASETEFIERLKGIREDSFYTAPEVMRERWAQVAWTCDKFGGDPNKGPEWKVTIAKILMGVEDYRKYTGVISKRPPKLNNDPDFSVYNWGKGIPEFFGDSFMPQIAPIECHIKEDGSKDDKPVLIFVCVGAGEKKYISQISLKMFQPVLQEIAKYEQRQTQS